MLTVIEAHAEEGCTVGSALPGFGTCDAAFQCCTSVALLLHHLGYWQSGQDLGMNRLAENQRSMQAWFTTRSQTLRDGC